MKCGKKYKNWENLSSIWISIWEADLSGIACPSEKFTFYSSPKEMKEKDLFSECSRVFETKAFVHDKKFLNWNFWALQALQALIEIRVKALENFPY